MSDAQQPSDKLPASSIPTEIASAPSIAVEGGSVGDVVPTSNIEFSSRHREFAAFHEPYISGNIDRADTKAIWAFAVASGLLAFLLGNDAIRLLFVHWGLKSALLGLVLVLLAASAFHSFLVIVPRLYSSERDPVYFGAVAKRSSLNAYLEELRGMDDNSLTRARISHCYDLAKICAKKYRRLQIAVWLGAVAFIGLLVFMMLG